jgi:hypothetical protein
MACRLAILRCPEGLMPLSPGIRHTTDRMSPLESAIARRAAGSVEVRPALTDVRVDGARSAMNEVFDCGVCVLVGVHALGGVAKGAVDSGVSTLPGGRGATVRPIKKRFRWRRPLVRLHRASFLRSASGAASNCPPGRLCAGGVVRSAREGTCSYGQVYVAPTLHLDLRMPNACAERDPSCGGPASGH